ncbi:tRNA (N(6)-L-threonylcarbamoyladenosine(37)-C(2))-methylthiotransferase MtaB [Ponticaulis koreensis]|uniref:tRNA (N(6)-L-threonylcarbamoyladenosine(37)-C(2))- methylthiotransferase MtaB n=1 Tax=Ponticaulis koreensis TaxID=1123045 RepID=UPI0003B67FB7|nr:tRNA (N(6)-L-threonylcarbamoyladenosine(37)-C(2))-methylthiotransferase MtaB [Ponticaulis koreensis]
MTDRTPTSDKLQIITHGCRLNSYESEVMRDHAEAAGLSDAVIINTCAVTAEAVRQARQSIRRAHRDNPDAPIIVTGCAAQIDPTQFAEMPEVTRVIGNHEKMKAETFTSAHLMDAPEKVSVDDIMTVRETAGHLVDGLDGRARAFVHVQNGCDHRCTFCIIPYGRGNSRSVPAGEVVDQVKRLVARGHKEVVLTGVDLTSWGGDLPNTPPLGNLVARILKLVPDLPLLRLSSIDAIEMDEALFELAASEPRFAPYLHISLQHGDPMILKRMKRRHSREDAIELTSKLKTARPDIAFGADLIAGFPTETEEMFENSVSLIEACDLSFVHVFPYSSRERTPAAKMPQLERKIVKERAARLREAANAALERHLKKHVGEIRRVLVEAGGQGRLADFTPVTGLPDALPHGEFADIRITGHTDGRLTGVIQ